MTRDEAFTEATRRWSAPDATIGTIAGPYLEHSRGLSQCQVGVVGAFGGFIVRGFGPSWEAAFADADRRLT